MAVSARSALTAVVPAQRQASVRSEALPLVGLPPAAVAAVRAAFSGEVSRRLPLLENALQAAGNGAGRLAGDDLAAVVRAAHTLASGAAIVGEVVASKALREVEYLFASSEPNAAELTARLEPACVLLAAWRETPPTA
jgi:chemotaxis protein histidine kinase CheA